MQRKDPMVPEEQGSPETWVTHNGDNKKNDGGASMFVVSSSSSLNSQRSTKDGEGWGAHRVGQDGGRDGTNKIRSTDFSSLKVPFPWRLWQLLEDSEKNGNQSIVSWLPEGDGIAISKPRAFTSTIMKAYFTLTTYDSFVQELFRYGFTRTTMEENNLTRVEVFRNPRYHRKEKLKSLAIRRRSLTRSFTERFAAAAKEQRNQHCENNEISSCCWPSSGHESQNNNRAIVSLLPITSEPHAQTGFNQNFQVAVHDAIHQGGVIEATMDRRIQDDSSSSSPLVSSIFIANDREDFRGRANNAGDNDFAFMVEAHKEFQHTHDGCHSTCSRSNTQYNQSADSEVRSLSFSLPDPISTLMGRSISTEERPDCKNHDHPSIGTSSLPTDCYNDWIARTSDQNHHTELLRRAWQFLETRGNDASWRPQIMHDTWSTAILPARPSNFSSTFSQLSQIPDNNGTQHELEKTLDEDIMESLFD